MKQLRFDLTFDYDDLTWTCTSPDAPGALGVHTEAYEALVDCAYDLFDKAENPDDVDKEHRKIYHELNIELFPYVPNTSEEIAPVERFLSEEQKERAARFFDEG